MISEHNWRDAFPFVLELSTEYRKKFQGQNLSADNAARSHLVNQVMFHLPEGNYEKARDLLDQASVALNENDDTLTKLDRRRVLRQKNRIRAVIAYYYLSLGDLSRAQNEFLLTVKNFKDGNNWSNKARALYAYRGLACVSLLNQPSDTDQALRYLRQAHAMVTEFQSKNTNAVNLQWELAALTELIARIESGDWVANNALSSSTNANNTLTCQNPGLLLLPAGPPEGWESITSKESYKQLIGVLKSIH